MKCVKCDSYIIIHNNLLPVKYNKGNIPLTYLDLTTFGSIYSREGLIEYSHNEICEVCFNNSLNLDKKQIKSYINRMCDNKPISDRGML